MREFHVGDLVVVEERNGKKYPVGVLTDRDLVVGVIAEAAAELPRLKVEDILTERPLLTAHRDEDITEVVRRMKDAAVRRVPVVDEDGALVGVISADDIIEVIGDMASAVGHLFKNQWVTEWSRRN
jgi:CBS domain-containing protein